MDVFMTTTMVVLCSIEQILLIIQHYSKYTARKIWMSVSIDYVTHVIITFKYHNDQKETNSSYICNNEGSEDEHNHM